MRAGSIVARRAARMMAGGELTLRSVASYRVGGALAQARMAASVPSSCRRTGERAALWSRTTARAFSTAAPDSLLDVKVVDGIATITLNDEKKRNALSTTLMGQLRDELLRLRNGHEGLIKACVIRHDGKVFSSGHDLKELHLMQSTQGTTQEVFSVCGEMMMGVREAEFPVIAVVNGLATAGGCQLVAMCDVAIASENSTFATPGVKIGLFCTTPGVALARAIPRKAAMHMLLSGDPLSAAEAAQLGLISKAVPAANLDAAVQRLTAQIAGAATPTVRLGKKAFYRQAEMPDVRDAYALGTEVMVDNMQQPDAQEGIAAFVEKRAPTWTA